MEAFALKGADTSIATAGHQNISFSYTDQNLRQRIDRFHYLGGKNIPLDSSRMEKHLLGLDIWVFGNPGLVPMDYSLTVHGGNNGWACYVKSNNDMLEPRTVTDGYTDGIF
jgi:hypothetical protein